LHRADHNFVVAGKKMTELLDSMLEMLSFVGITVFAISGALYAAERKMDIIAFILIGTVTGIGGGTLRDLLLGVTPVFWVQAPIHVMVSIIAAGITYFAVKLINKRYQWILWMDAIGLAVFAMAGSQTALAMQDSMVIAVVMGVMTATFGGIIRDMICAEVLTLLRPEIYITAALLGSVVYVCLYTLGVDQNITMLASLGAGFSLRALAILYGLKLPTYKSD
jgi:uncharacterized membrane protein YeiH